MSKKKVTFSLPVAALGNATEAILLGDFNNWDLDQAVKLKHPDAGTLQTTVTLETGKTYEYRFLLNDGTWVNDWSAQSYVHKSLFGIDNSVIHVTDEAEKTTAKTSKSPSAKRPVPAKKAPAKKTAPRKSKAVPAADDLTKINGIDTSVAQLLQKENIRSFKDLAKTTIKKLKAVLEEAGYNADPKTWPKEAKAAAGQ